MIITRTLILFLARNENFEYTITYSLIFEIPKETDVPKKSTIT